MDLLCYEEKSQKIIGKEDDCDLGDLAWISVDEGQDGRADAVIFETINLSKSGIDELNGIEIQLWEYHFPRQPGIDGRLSYVYLERNEFENGKRINKKIPAGYTVEFNAEFFTTKKKSLIFLFMKKWN